MVTSGLQRQASSVPSRSSRPLTPRPTLPLCEAGADRMGHGKWGAWEDWGSNLPSTDYCPETPGKSPRLCFLIISPGLTGLSSAHVRDEAPHCP